MVEQDSVRPFLRWGVAGPMRSVVPGKSAKGLRFVHATWSASPTSRERVRRVADVRVRKRGSRGIPARVGLGGGFDWTSRQMRTADFLLRWRQDAQRGLKKRELFPVGVLIRATSAMIRTA